MAKRPAAGSTKTRLVPRLTPQEAADLYECFLLDALDLARSVPEVTALVAVSPPEASEYFAEIAPDLGQITQVGSSLGERLDHVLTRCLERGYDQAVAINSDSPTLPASHVVDAFARLDDESVDAVIGPADDGGYYLMGWKRRLGELVQGVAMSTPHVLADTLERATRYGLNVSLLAPWYDVDEPDDLDRLAADLDTGSGPESHTQRFLATVSLQQT